MAELSEDILGSRSEVVKPSRWSATRKKVREEQRSRQARDAMIKKFQGQAREMGKASLANPRTRGQQQYIDELELQLAKLQANTDALAKDNEVLEQDRDQVLDDVENMTPILKTLRAEGKDVRTELNRLSQLQQVRCVQEAREAARAAVDRVAAEDDPSLMPGLQEWLVKHKLVDGAAPTVLQWCADNAFVSVDDILCFLRGSDGMTAFVGSLGLEKGQAAQLTQSLQKEQKEQFNVESTRNSQKRKRGDGGAAFVKKATESLKALQQRVEVLQKLVLDGIKDVKELEQVQTEARQAQHRLQRAQAAENAISFRWVVVSTPIRGPDGADVFGVIKALNVEFAELTLGCDWPGSPNARDADKAAFQSIFSADGLFKKWKDSGMSETVLDEIVEVVVGTLWWQLYKGGVKGALRMTAFAGDPVKAVCIEGGPISRVEAKMMQTIADEVTLELSVLGRKEAVIEILRFESAADFERHFRGQAAMWSKFEEQADQPRPQSERGEASRDDSAQACADPIPRRWREGCEQLHHANEHLWLEMCQRKTKGPSRPPSDLVMLQQEAGLLSDKTAALLASLRPSTGPSSGGSAVCLSRSTGSLPSLRTR